MFCYLEQTKTVENFGRRVVGFSGYCPVKIQRFLPAVEMPGSLVNL